MTESERYVSTDYEGVVDNIVGWQAGRERLDVASLFSALEDLYGPDTPTNYCARMLADIACLEIR
jgi:hypothetical protein